MELPLHYLPTFELAARHASFKRAAQELHLTPSAVSQQMRALEDALGLALFHRRTRALELTAAGVQFASLVADTLEGFRRGSERLLRQHGQRVLRLTADPFVVNEVLVPALHIRAAFELRIETSAKLLDLERDDVDAAVRYGIGPWPGLSASKLCDATLTLICAPGLLKGDKLRTPASLARHPLIRLRDQPDPWPHFARAFGVTVPAERLVFDSYFASVRAAEKGLGIAVGLFPITTQSVLEGRLVTPLPLHVRARAAFHFVCRRDEAERQELLALAGWLQARFAELPRLPAAARTVDEATLLSARRARAPASPRT